ncbi:MFS transporter [Cystobacter fuscus]|uniref:MFS transporter n=1 Tax=Cystobacter fuscus TaxID=43 RepID=UPI002B28D5B4|nr:MFS transporter [Cystobacter fuscus]
MTTPVAPPAGGFRTFVTIWSGQAISLLGSRVSRLALGVWLFQKTGEVTDFVFIALCDALPILVLMPFTGMVADRYDQRKVMLLADTAAALCTLGMVGLTLSGIPRSGWLYLAVLASASAGALQSPAWSAAMARLVPAEQAGRAVGMAQASEGIAAIFAPSLAGGLVAATGLMGALLFDFATFLLGVSVLLRVRFPGPSDSERAAHPSSAFWRELGAGLSYVLSRPGLVGLLLLSSLVSMTVFAVEVLVPPMLLARNSPAVMGWVLSASGLGAVCGSVAMSAWGGPRRKMDGVLGAGALLGLMLGMAGGTPSPWVMAVAGWAAMFCVPLVWGCAHTVWQLEVPLDLQGRVVALRRMMGEAASLLGLLGAGPLTDRVLEPMMSPEGALAGTAGRLIGTGRGRGIGLLLILLGVGLLLTMALGRSWRRLYRVEDKDSSAPTPTVLQPEK